MEIIEIQNNDVIKTASKESSKQLIFYLSISEIYFKGI